MGVTRPGSEEFIERIVGSLDADVKTPSATLTAEEMLNEANPEPPEKQAQTEKPPSDRNEKHATIIMKEANPEPPEKQAKTEEPPSDGSEKRITINTTEDENDKSDHHKFEIDDWVVVNHRLASVIRIGYDQYRGKVRVAQPDEDPRVWSSGRCCPASALQALNPCHRFQVRSTFLSADEPRVEVLDGTSGRLVSFDMDGDVVVRLDGDPKKHYEFLEDARHVVME